MVATLVLEASGEIRVGSSPTWGTKICERGGMVYTADLKSAAFGIEGSSPSAHTNF